MTMSSITNPVRESFSDQPRVGVKQLKVPQVANVQLETLGSVERHKVSVRKVICIFFSCPEQLNR